MFRRADRFDVDSGGRFDRRGAAIVIWSASLSANREAAEPQAEAHFLWRTPGKDQATLWRVAWDPAEGGSEDTVWEGLAALAGRPLPTA